MPCCVGFSVYFLPSNELSAKIAYFLHPTKYLWKKRIKKNEDKPEKACPRHKKY